MGKLLTGWVKNGPIFQDTDKGERSGGKRRGILPQGAVLAAADRCYLPVYCQTFFCLTAFIKS
jgi:hypothetical protein